jgi:hypothetical protein
LLTAMVGHSRLDDGIVTVATQLDTRSPAMHAAVAQLLAGESVLGASALPLANRAALERGARSAGSALALTAMAQAPGTDALTSPPKCLSV